MVYYVQFADTLESIASRFNTGIEILMRMNGIVNPNQIFIGQALMIPQDIRQPNGYSIEIDKKQRILKLLKNGKVIKQYPVAIGKPSTPTPTGSWVIIKKALWGAPFGGHFMQLSIPWGIYGIHGTDKPWSIGQAVSHGCVRMYSSDAAELYNTVSVGTPVLIY